MIDEKKLIKELEKWMNDTAYLKEKYSGATQFKDRTGENIMYAHAEIAHDVISEVIGKINKQQKVGEWIPCSERMPEKTGYYLVQLSRKLPNEDYADRVVVLYNGEDKKFMTYERLIIAWQPLPEPYKPDSVDTEKPEWKDRMMQTFLGGRR